MARRPRVHRALASISMEAKQVPLLRPIPLLMERTESSMRITITLFCLSCLCSLFFAPLSLAKRANPSEEQSPRELRREKRRLERFLRKAKNRLGEVQYLISRLSYLQRAMTMVSNREVRYRSADLLERVRDRVLKSLLNAYLSSVDGKRKCSEGEKESFLRLSMELENSMREVKKVALELRQVNAELAEFVPPKMKRKMHRRVNAMLRESRGVKHLDEKLKRARLAVEEELEACRLDQSRSRSKLRNLRGKYALAKKRKELAKARSTFAQTIKETLADDRLSAQEKQVLTERQKRFSQLKHTLAALDMKGY